MSLRRAAVLVALAAVLLPGHPAGAQSPGVDAPVPVGPFMNGVFPTTTPRDPASAQWDVVPAFPNISLTDPLVIVTNPANNRLYVGSREGVIVSFMNSPNATQTNPFLDLRDRVAVVWDGGFLGMAFDPQFGVPGSPHRGHVYVWYSSYCPIDATRRLVNLAACNPGYPTSPTDGFFGTWLRLSRFTVPDGQGMADPASERVMINFRLINSTHRGGGMLFMPDGTFWLTIGDQWRYETAQELTNTLEGKTLRLALDITENGNGTWSCPAGSHQPIRAFGRL
ncbi:MAG TPA: PQQ-dependent sugar dehydrogenase, partial [Myxococcota bacterium]|nr:PQQ-dependent sugar dehydrogenase [Myxococcota bacterium]